MTENRIKILAIDDNRDNLTVLKAVVADSLPGLVFFGADNGEDGVKLAISEDPDVILLDIVMPGMDGYEVCRRLKRDEYLKTIPILFLTALRTDRASRIKALQVGGDGFLSKPFDELELVAQIQAMAKVREANRLQCLEKEELSALVVERTKELEQELLEKKRAEEALRASEAKMRSILDNAEIGVALISSGMEILDINQRMKNWFPGVDPEYKPVCHHVLHDPPLSGVCRYCPTFKTFKDGQVHETTATLRREGVARNFRIISSPVLNSEGIVTAVVEMFEDITHRTLLESQLRQSQKMESIGRLAGGVAHDFNNMLGVILGYTEIVIDKVGAYSPLLTDLNEISKAGKRAADLTRQLLAFARKQAIAPKLLDLNGTLEEMLKMLQRLIGEDIELVWSPGADLWQVRMDPSQIDQILANLCVNARDAISGVGHITIKTENVTVDEACCRNNSDASKGEFVLISVGDNGCGMDVESMNKIFEPFFTTKEIGKGTGLGLATVYGIVRQNNGFIEVQSEPGLGSTFEIHLPRFIPDESFISSAGDSDINLRGDETILIVEDEPAILQLTTIMLESAGYTVIAASGPEDAITLAREHAGNIDLLITDVIMPHMNGSELAEKLMELYGNIRCLFMSGYPADLMRNKGVIRENMHFIQKPFSVSELTIGVREALDALLFPGIVSA